MSIETVVILLIVAFAAGSAFLYVLAVLLSGRKNRTRRKSTTVKQKHGISVSTLRSVTRLIFVTTQISALIWVFTSYGIAIYSTVVLGQVYTMAELSEPAIHTILGVGFLKVLENIFEHNDSVVFGRSKKEESAPSDSEGEEGAG